jgi:hypothetical protein
MAKVAKDNATIASTVKSSHITYKYNTTNSTGGTTVHNSSTSATITGTCNASTAGVFVNGINPVLMGDQTTEDDTAGSMNSGAYDIQNEHTGALGSVTNGNASNVFVGGKSVSIEGSTVTTHASTSSQIDGGGSSNVFIGG